MAELVTLPAHNVARVPAVSPELTWAEAAAFSLVTLTAWRMVVTRAQVKAGETVLIWGIGGGVSLAALRIAKLFGARVIVTSSNDAKLAAARRLGADVILNHHTQQVSQEVRALTQKRGVELVTCGATSGPDVRLDLRRVFWHHYTIMGSTMGNAREYAEIVRRLGEGQLRPIVDRVYPLTEARAAYERLAKGEQLGKVV